MDNKDNSKYSKMNSSTNNDWDDVTKIIGNRVSNMQQEDEFLDEVHASLANQIIQEMDNYNLYNEYEEETDEPAPKKKKAKKIILGVLGTLALLFVILIPTGLGKKVVASLLGNYIYGNLEYNDNNTANQNNGKTNIPVKDMYGDVVNILLVGVEEIGGGANTDSIMIATMNTKTNTIKITSLMRDLYVEIPGYEKNRINSAFSKGGIELLYQTITNNFDIKLDGYAMVNFESFEKVIDILGGIEITLTQGEANYLNSTNYISDPANRKVIAGKQIMNGNQALGYARVRKVSTGTENNDFGRTQRHRTIINAVFNKIKEKNIIQLGITMNDILNNVDIETDVPNNGFNALLEKAIGMNLFNLNIENYRIPSDGNYNNIKVKMGKYNQEVLEPKDWAATRQELHDFIYGVELTITVSPVTQ